MAGCAGIGTGEQGLCVREWFGGGRAEGHVCVFLQGRHAGLEVAGCVTCRVSAGGGGACKCQMAQSALACACVCREEELQWSTGPNPYCPHVLSSHSYAVCISKACKLRTHFGTVPQSLHAPKQLLQAANPPPFPHPSGNPTTHHHHPFETTNTIPHTPHPSPPP